MTERLKYMDFAPDAMQAFFEVQKCVAKSGLRKSLIDLVYLRVSQMNGCAFCIDKHSRDLLADGFSVEKLILIPVWYEGGDLFTDREQAALVWAEVVTRVSETRVSDEDYAKALTVFSDKELVNLTMAISVMNAMNRVAISFRVIPESVKSAL
jgi:AhpD family alkylhydroperoxidase